MGHQQKLHYVINDRLDTATNSFAVGEMCGQNRVLENKFSFFKKYELCLYEGGITKKGNELVQGFAVWGGIPWQSKL